MKSVLRSATVGGALLALPTTGVPAAGADATPSASSDGPGSNVDAATDAMAGNAIRSFARILGVGEIRAGVAIALRPVLPRLAALGGAFVAVLFAVTLAFLFSTPGAYESDGFPLLSPEIGQFLAKDLMLLAASIWVVGDSLAAHGHRSGAPEREDVPVRHG